MLTQGVVVDGHASLLGLFVIVWDAFWAPCCIFKSTRTAPAPTKMMPTPSSTQVLPRRRPPPNMLPSLPSSGFIPTLRT